MKISTLFFAAAITLSVTDSAFSQNVQFNDIDFKNILLANAEINTNGDDEIQLAEAEAFSGKMELNNVTISDLTGLETFTNLTELSLYSVISIDLDVSANTSLERLTATNLSDLILGDNESLQYVFTDLNNFSTLTIDNSHLDTLLCWHNNFPMLIDLDEATSLEYLSLNDNGLPLLDVTTLPNLKTLFCDVNAITTLDLSNNPLLEYLECKINPLQALDVSENPNLQYLSCPATPLTSLDLSQNPELKTLICYYTSISYLDLSQNDNLTWLDGFGGAFELVDLKNGNNSNMEYLDMRETSNLECIQVDNVDYSASNWLNVSTPTVYNSICEGITTNWRDLDEPQIQVNAYPNPTKSELNLQFEEMQSSIRIEVYDNIGRRVKTANYNSLTSINLDLRSLSGMLFIKVIVDGYQTTLKVLKE